MAETPRSLEQYTAENQGKTRDAFNMNAEDSRIFDQPGHPWNRDAQNPSTHGNDPSGSTQVKNHRPQPELRPDGPGAAQVKASAHRQEMNADHEEALRQAAQEVSARQQARQQVRGQGHERGM